MSDVLDLVDSSDVEDDCILESVTYVNQKEIDKNNFNYLYKENPLLVEFIEKCYDIENSKGMSRIINKTLIRFYNKTNKTFRKSPDLEKILKRSINMLETNPVMICNHIKELCDILNSFSVRKRIKPVTLSTNLEDKCPKIEGNGILKRKNSFDDPCKVSKVFITDVDKIEDETEEIQPVNNNIEKTNTIIDSEKENQSINEFADEEDNILLVPQKVVEIGDIRDPLDMEKIKKIEKEIARCTTVISKLDEQEVDDDSVNSPYIKSEKLKAKIVILYEQLCNLTGNQPVKKRTINLRVIEGHPEGPVHCLETFLINNIGPDGVPPFPDFSDVVECVGEANSRDNLGWTKHQILQEGVPMASTSTTAAAASATAPLPSTSAGAFTEVLSSSHPGIQTYTTSTGNDQQTSPTEAIVALDTELLLILGDDPSQTKSYGEDIQPDLAIRLQHIASSGMPKDVRKELMDKYLLPANCTLIEAPTLNPEVVAAVPEAVLKRDKGIEVRQKQRSSAISCIGKALTLLMTLEPKSTALIQILMDGIKLMCDSQNTDSIIRRSFVLNTLKKDLKDQLQATKIDKMLFSESLAETLKTAKAISKSGADILKSTSTKLPPAKTKPTPKHLN